MSLAIFRNRFFFFSASGAASEPAQTEPYSWTREPLNPQTAEESKFVPLDDVLQVRVIGRSGVRQAVKEYVRAHYDHPASVRLASGRGKLIAELLELSETCVLFRDLVQIVDKGLRSSESQPIRALDARDLARRLCQPAS